MNLILFLPETILLLLCVLLLCLMLGRRESPERWLNPFMLLSSAALIASCLFTLRRSGFIFYSTYEIGLLSQGFKLLLSLALFFTVIFSEKWTAIPEGRRAEFFLFLSTATLGMMMITSAADVLTLFISLELSSYSLYLLTALRPERRNAEAGVKYLLTGAASSGIFLWGASLLMGLAGSASLAEIADKSAVLSSQPAFALGIVLVTFVLLFKLSAFPMHFWAPDVYESAATPVTNFIATASKAAAAAILIRLFMFLGLSGGFIRTLGVLAFISMTIGNAVALVQQDVKRLLAYSSIAQAGYLLVGLLAGSLEGYSSAFFYAFAYLPMNTGAFLVIVLVAREERHDNPQLAHLDGLAERSPMLALILLLSLLSLAGIPPLIGFTGKWILFSAAMNEGHWFLVLWGVLNSVVSLFYYLTLVKHAYLEKPRTPAPLVLPIHLKTLCLFLSGAIVFLGIFPDFFITFAREAVLDGMAR